MTSVNAVQKGLKSLRRHYASDDKDLLRIVLNADSMFEANLAVGVLKESIPEKPLVTAVNVREVFHDLPTCPFTMGVDLETLARVAKLEGSGNTYRRHFRDRDGDWELLVLGDGNLCFDAAVVAEGVKVPWTAMPGYDDIVNQEFVDLVLSRKTVLKEIVGFVQDSGVPFAPTFYMSMDDWNLEYVEDVLADMTKLF
jgi:hypothetical protein